MVTGPAEVTKVVGKFEGEATIRTDYPFLPGPYHPDITYNLTFTEDWQKASLLPFEEQEFDLGGSSIKMSIAEGGEGTFDKTTGEMEIPTTFLFESALLGNARIQLALTTGTASSPDGNLEPVVGSPLNAATGKITIVGASEFEASDPAINGVDATIAFAGTLTFET